MSSDPHLSKDRKIAPKTLFKFSSLSMKETQLQEAARFCSITIGVCFAFGNIYDTQLSLNMQDHVLLPRDKQGNGGGFCVHG